MMYEFYERIFCHSTLESDSPSDSGAHDVSGDVFFSYLSATAKYIKGVMTWIFFILLF